MTRAQLIAAEACLVAAGLLFLYFLFGRPFDGAGGGGSVGDEIAGAAGVSVDPMGGPGTGESDATDDDKPAVHECARPVDRDFLSSNQVVTFYGSPYSGALGILGELPPEQVIERLKAQAQLYDEANGFRGVQMGLHVVSTTAQPSPGSDGLYRLQVDMETLREWVDRACDNGLVIFLDIQVGHADFAAEVERLAPLLAEPHVHLALDPEFKMKPGEVPGQAIGGYTAEEINQVQATLQRIVEEKGLPDKILVVHQFQENMIDRPWDIAQYGNVRTVVVMDGFADPASKKAQYLRYAQPAPYSGIKLFYKQDHPLMTESEVVRLRPDVIIYQ
jgi:hypothetical protein